jgi:two-component system, NtrC family, sensor histidine kinase HydH
MMGAHDWLTLVSCAGVLAFFLLAVTRGSKSPMGLPLALLSLDLFTFNLAPLAYDLTRNRIWEVVDNTASPLIVPLMFHFAASFVGRRRQLRVVLIVLYVAFGALALVSPLGVFVPGVGGFTGSTQWSWTFLLAIPIPLLLGIGLLVDHLVRASGDERQRTRVLFLALLTLVCLGATDLVQNTGVPIPRLGSLGALVFTGLTAVVALRLRLFDRDLSSSGVVVPLVAGALGILIYAAAFRWLEPNTALLVLATITLMLGLMAASVSLLIQFREKRLRQARLALTGRFAAQMAHDLKNPIAAAKGAVQFLAEEVAQGRSLSDNPKFLGLIQEQLARLEAVVDRYHRLSHVEPVLAETDANEVVRRVLALQSFAAGSSVTVQSALSPDLPRCRVDADLLATAIENLIRNAFEAMPAGGTVTVRTAPAEIGDVVISVQDTGPGMDSRTRERIFDDFFTTKATGSGLGLAFVKRVAEAHGGAVAVSTRQGHGTTMQIRLPSRPKNAAMP